MGLATTTATKLKLLLAVLALAVISIAAVQVRTNFATMSKLCPGCAISRGDQGMGQFVQFGVNNNVDDVRETIYLGPAFGGPPRMILDVVPITLFISSDSALADNEIVIRGIDNNWREVFVTATLSGTSFVQIGEELSWLRINRVANIGEDGLEGNIFVHTDSSDDVVDGMPDDPLTQLRAVVLMDEGVSAQAVFSVADDFDAFMTQICYNAFVSMGSEGFARLSIVTHAGTVDDRENSASVLITTPNDSCRDFDPPIHYASRTAFEITALGDSANSNLVVSVAINIILSRTRLDG